VSKLLGRSRASRRRQDSSRSAANSLTGTEPASAHGSPEPDNAALVTLRSEIREFAENCAYRAECQITAAGWWGNLQLYFGAAAAITAGIAGASAFAKQSVTAGAFAVTASVLAAVLGTVKAGERAASYEHYGNEFNLISECAHRLYELSAVALPAPPKLVDEFKGIVAQRDELVRKAPFVNRRLCRRAIRYLEDGESYTAVVGRPAVDTASSHDSPGG